LGRPGGRRNFLAPFVPKMEFQKKSAGRGSTNKKRIWKEREELGRKQPAPKKNKPQKANFKKEK